MRTRMRQVPSSLPANDALLGKSVLLSASFPAKDRNPVFYQTAEPDELSQAIVALARAVFALRGKLTFGGHPSVSPLVMMISQEYADETSREPLVYIYQSNVFRDSLSSATLTMARLGLGRIIWTPTAQSEQDRVGRTTDPRAFPESLAIMRRRMLRRRDIVGAVFVGGMEGIEREAAALASFRPATQVFYVGGPGGAARQLAEQSLEAADSQEKPWMDELRRSRQYPSLMQLIALRIAGRNV